MPIPERSPYIRVLPGTDTLDIILKNTHFPDDLLSENVECHLRWEEGTPVLVFQFNQAAYDFSEPLVPAELKGGERDWLQPRLIQTRLLLADNVVTDQVTARTFFLTMQESDEIRKVFEQTNTWTMPSGI